MASIIESLNLGSAQGLSAPSCNDGKFFLFKAGSVRSPSQKILFADERMTYEMTETQVDEFNKAYTYAWDAFASSAYYWSYDKLTRRHTGKGNVALADGHVETVRPEYAQKPEHYDPLY